MTKDEPKSDRREDETEDAYVARKTAERQWANLSSDEQGLHAKSLSQDKPESEE